MVDKMVDDEREAGIHTVQYGAEKLAGGMYCYRIDTGSRSEVKKMMVFK